MPLDLNPEQSYRTYLNFVFKSDEGYYFVGGLMVAFAELQFMRYFMFEKN